jgi:hypothetical protein
MLSNYTPSIDLRKGTNLITISHAEKKEREGERKIERRKGGRRVKRMS